MMIGLDIGTDVIRACLFDGSFGRYTFVRTIEEFVPQSSLQLSSETTGSVESDEQTEEVDKDIMALADLERRQSGAIQAALRNLTVNGLVTHQQATQVSVRLISLPFTNNQSIAEVLPSTVEELVPFDIDDIQIQHHILNVHEKSSDVLVLITRTDIIESHLDKLEGLGLQPQHIVIDGDILGYYAKTGVQCILHCQENQIVCGLYRDGKTLTFRTLVESHLICSEESPILSQHQIERLRKTLVLFEDNHQIDIEEILLSGAVTAALQQQIHEEMDVPCSILQLPHNLDPKWALAYALGEKGCGNSHGREFDLRYGHYAYQGNVQKMATLLQYVALACVIGFIGFSGWFWMQKIAIQKEIDTLNEAMVAQIQTTMPDLPKSVLSNPSTVVSLMQEEISTANEKLEKLGSITSHEPPILTLVKEISEGMPPHEKARIDVSEMVITKTNINLKAETDGFQTATEIEQTLKKKPRFKQAQKADEKSMRDGIRFSIIIPLGIDENAEENDAASEEEEEG